MSAPPPPAARESVRPVYVLALLGLIVLSCVGLRVGELITEKSCMVVLAGAAVGALQLLGAMRRANGGKPVDPPGPVVQVAAMAGVGTLVELADRVDVASVVGAVTGGP